MEKCSLFQAVLLIFTTLLQVLVGLPFRLRNVCGFFQKGSLRLETVGRYLGSQEVVSLPKSRGGPKHEPCH